MVLLVRNRPMTSLRRDPRDEFMKVVLSIMQAFGPFDRFRKPGLLNNMKFLVKLMRRLNMIECRTTQ